MNFFDKIKINLKVARWGEEFKDAENLIRTGANEEALEILNRILKIESDLGTRFTAFLYKSCVLNPLGKFQEAIDNINEIIKIEPDCTFILEQKGDALRGLGKYQEAIESYNEVLKNEPNNILTLKNKGVALGQLGKYQEAINIFDKALEIEPWSINTISNKEFALNCLKKLGNNINGGENSVVRIIKIRVPDKKDMWVIGEQEKDETWNIYLIHPQEKYKELIEENMTTEAFAILSNKTLKTSFPYEK